MICHQVCPTNYPRLPCPLERRVLPNRPTISSQRPTRCPRRPSFRQVVGVARPTQFDPWWRRLRPYPRHSGTDNLLPVSVRANKTHNLITNSDRVGSKPHATKSSERTFEPFATPSLTNTSETSSNSGFCFSLSSLALFLRLQYRAIGVGGALVTFELLKLRFGNL